MKVNVAEFRNHSSAYTLRTRRTSTFQFETSAGISPKGYSHCNCMSALDYICVHRRDE